MEIYVKVEKRDGKNTKDEKQEITISIQGKMVVYGEDSLSDFKRELQTLIEKYAI